MIISVCCRICKIDKILEVQEEGFKRWKNKEKLIQDALPELNKKDRELLISKTCGECWSLMFGDDDE